MDFKVTRKIYTDHSTRGQLSYEAKERGEQFLSCTLEDVVRPAGAEKVPGQTAIPAGKYELELSFSPHFNKTLPHIKDVPGFDGIRLHGGNTAVDTEGCVLVATHAISEDMIQGNNVDEVVRLMTANEGPHSIEIVDTHPSVLVVPVVTEVARTAENGSTDDAGNPAFEPAPSASAPDAPAA